MVDSYKIEFINFISNCLPSSQKMTSRFPENDFPVPGKWLPGSQKMTSPFPENDFPVEGRSVTSGFKWSLVPWSWVTFLSRPRVCVWWRMSFQTHILLTNYETTKKRDSGQYFRCPSGFNFMFVTLFSSPTLAALFSSATSSLLWRWRCTVSVPR